MLHGVFYSPPADFYKRKLDSPSKFSQWETQNAIWWCLFFDQFRFLSLKPSFQNHSKRHVIPYLYVLLVHLLCASGSNNSFQKILWIIEETNKSFNSNLFLCITAMVWRWLVFSDLIFLFSFSRKLIFSRRALFSRWLNDVSCSRSAKCFSKLACFLMPSVLFASVAYSISLSRFLLSFSLYSSSSF